MVKDDFVSASGPLKLKGVTSSKIDKKKRKKKATSSAEDTERVASPATEKSPAGKTEDVEKALREEDEEGDTPGTARLLEEESIGHTGKTEAEKRHEEMRRRRLDERLKREGVKTHKERVEALNKYLSNLSEHHDM
ncbi:MAG: hypothetical protein M1827_004129 [Pycnora praestabilis]|nr:MAG: hypothetical protein M1827_004129 [Pycnora praestabilis]